MMLAVGRLFAPDYFVIVAYFALMLGVGAFFYRWMKAMKDYFAGGNQIPWWLSGVSYYMSAFSAFSFISFTALAYQYGLVGVALYWVTVPAAFFSTLLFSKRWRRARINSPVEYLETRYNPVVRQLFAWQGVPVKLIDDSLKLIAIGTFLVILVGDAPADSLEARGQLETAMLFAGGIMLLYTFMGGLWAVMVTDFLQFLVQTAAVLILFPLAFVYAISRAGGLSGFLDATPDGFFNLVHPKYGWIYLGTNVALYFLSYCVNWSLVQRFYCVPTEKDARKVGYLVVVLNIITPPLMFGPGIAAAHFLPGFKDANRVFPEMCLQLLPMGLVGLMVAAMFSATMSMLSSDYNVCAGVLTNDVYRRLLRPSASQKELVRVGRFMTLFVGVISLGIAFAINRSGSAQGDGLFRTMVTLFSIAVPPVAIPMLWGLISPRVGSWAALTGFGCGIATGVVMLLRWPHALFSWIPVEGTLFKGTALEAGWKIENLIFWISGAVTFIIMILVERLVPQTQAERARAAAFLERMDVPIGRLPEDLPGRSPVALSPFRLVGGCTMIIGLSLLAITPWVSGDGTVATGQKLARELNAGLGLTLIAAGALMLWKSRRAGQSPSPAEPAATAEAL